MTFDALFVPDQLRAAVSEEAWVEALLEFEAALAVDAVDLSDLDVDGVIRAARASGNPAAALIGALDDDRLHRGATSQDAMDTAAMLVARRARTLVLADLDGAAAACAVIASAHRATVMPARTLLQQALPTTFGLKAAGWLVALLDARDRLRSIPLAVQLGGAAGTLAALGDDGLSTVARVAERLELEEPLLPWHAARGRVAELGSALALAAGAAEKIARDIALLAQTEVAEVGEPAPGGSSTLPHKRNPIGSVLAIACAHRVRGSASVLIATMGGHEHERAAGAWHAEWGVLSDALAYTGGAAAALRGVLEGLEVDADRMRANLDPRVMAESVSLALAARVGSRSEAATRVRAVAERSPASFRDALVADAAIELTPDELDRALDPASYLGSADALVERALNRYREES